MFYQLIVQLICLLLVKFNKLDENDIDNNLFYLLLVVSIITGFCTFFIDSKYIFFGVYKILTIIFIILMIVGEKIDVNIDDVYKIKCYLNLLFKFNKSKVAYHLLSFHYCENCKYNFTDEKIVCKNWQSS